MKKISLVTLLIICVVIIHTLFFPRRSTTRKRYIIGTYFSVNSDRASGAPVDGYFISDNREAGFFSSGQGMINYIPPVEGQLVEANQHGYVLFEKNGENLFFFSPGGDLLGTAYDKGYPYMNEHYPYVHVLSPDGKGFSLFTLSGSRLYPKRQLNSLITAISIDKDAQTVVSTIDANTLLINPEGKSTYMIENYKSKINITKANTIQEGGAYIGLTTGIEPEFIEIYDRESKSKVHSFQSGTNFNHQSYIAFNNGRIYYEGVQALNYLDLEKEKSGQVKYAGELLEVTYAGNGNILLLSQRDSIRYLYLYSSNGIKIFYSEFSENIDNINFINDDTFYFKLNDYIVTMKSIRTA